MKATRTCIARTIVFLALAAAGCGAAVDGSPSGDDGSVSQEQDELTAASCAPAPKSTRARAVGGYLAKTRRSDSCLFGGPCECYLDGIKTSCSLVAACLRSGNCVLE